MDQLVAFLTLAWEQPFASLVYIIATILLTPLLWFQRLTQFPCDVILTIMVLVGVYVFCRVKDVRIVMGKR